MRGDRVWKGERGLTDSRDGEAGQRVRWPTAPRRTSHARSTTLLQERCGTRHRDARAVDNCMDGGRPMHFMQAPSGGMKRFPGHRAPLPSKIPIAFERNADRNFVTDICVGLWRVALIGITAASTCKRARTCFGVSNDWGARSICRPHGPESRIRPLRNSMQAACLLERSQRDAL